MSSRFRQSLTVFMLFSLCVLPVVCEAADDHIVPSPVLHQAVRIGAEARQTNLAKIEKFFSTEPAQNAFQTARIDPAKVSRAIALLNDEEVARLAAQSDKIQNELAAGALSNQQITYILIALATAVIILVIVAAK